MNKIYDVSEAYKMVGKWVQRMNQDGTPYNSWEGSACLVTEIDVRHERIIHSASVDCNELDFMENYWGVAYIETECYFRILTLEEVRTLITNFSTKALFQERFMGGCTNESQTIISDDVSIDDEIEKTEEHLDLDLKLPNLFDDL